MKETGTEPLVLRLEIDPVIEQVDSIIAMINQELPSHPGLARVSRCVAKVARDAKAVSRQLKRPIGWHRLPATFLVVALLLLAGWIYWQVFRQAQLRIAVPARDAVVLKSQVQNRVEVIPVVTLGSRENLERLRQGTVDVAFIQGGVEIPDEFPRIKLEQTETVLLFLREPLQRPRESRKIMTSVADQGSHSLVKIFVKSWGNENEVKFLHDWRMFTEDKAYVLPDDVDAVFAVVDPMGEELFGATARLADAGFRLVPPDIGAMSLRLDYLQEVQVRTGYLDPGRMLPAETIDTYAVSTYLVARNGLGNQQLSAAKHLLHPEHGFPISVEASFGTASEFAQGIEAICGILIYIGLAFLALLGLDVIAYRKRFHELNSLVSLISIHQSSKDVISGTAEEKLHNVTYLRVCSDLLGILSVVTGYYTQENSSLMYNRLSDIIHERCSALKINIQLKILHALIDLPSQEGSTGRLREIEAIGVLKHDSVTEK